MSKPRSDSPLRNLPPARQEQIIEWCTTAKSATCVGGYLFAREQLAADGFKVSLTALSDFYSWFQLQRVFERADGLTTDIEEMLTRKFPDIDPRKISEAGQLIFTLQAANARNQDAFVQMEKLRLDKETAVSRGAIEQEKLAQSDRRIRLLEKKAAEALKTIDNGKLSEAEKVSRIREIFKK